jgi:flagellar hook-associated protein FlgK
MDITGVRRYKLEVYDLPYWRTLSESQYWNSRNEALERVEQPFPKPAAAA